MNVLTVKFIDKDYFFPKDVLTYINLLSFTDNVNRFMRTIRKYGDINELSPDLVRNFIEKVVVYQAEKTDGKRKQVVEIFYNGVGAIPQFF